VIGALTALLAATLAAPCPATPVHVDPLPQSGSLAPLRWVQATPYRAGIVGMLFAYDKQLEDDALRPTFALWAHGVAPGGWNTKILWIVRNVHAQGLFTLRGRELAGTRTFRARFSRVTDASAQPAQGNEYASIVKVPAAGCWRLDVSSGSARGSLVVRVAEP
jgi:hypothetical protein